MGCLAGRAGDAGRHDAAAAGPRAGGAGRTAADVPGRSGDAGRGARRAVRAAVGAAGRRPRATLRPGVRGPAGACPRPVVRRGVRTGPGRADLSAEAPPGPAAARRVAAHPERRRGRRTAAADPGRPGRQRTPAAAGRVRRRHAPAVSLLSPLPRGRCASPRAVVLRAGRRAGADRQGPRLPGSGAAPAPASMRAWTGRRRPFRTTQ